MKQSATTSIGVVPTIRQASPADLPILTALMEQSVRRLNRQNYSDQVLESALTYVFGIDHHLIADGTYYVAEIEGEVAGCGGWSRNGKLYGGAQVQLTSEADQQVSTSDAAKIRAMFVHPTYARQGVGRRLIQVSELAARRAGFRRLELIATLTGEPLYRKCGFVSVELFDIVMPDGLSLRALRMEKAL
jgi:N-acetylglutamate synthase-like GNAT family acetyltransferase